jgi:hypothetical protein
MYTSRIREMMAAGGTIDNHDRLIGNGMVFVWLTMVLMMCRFSVMWLWLVQVFAIANMTPNLSYGVGKVFVAIYTLIAFGLFRYYE